MLLFKDQEYFICGQHFTFILNRHIFLAAFQHFSLKQYLSRSYFFSSYSDSHKNGLALQVSSRCQCFHQMKMDPKTRIQVDMISPMTLQNLESKVQIFQYNKSHHLILIFFRKMKNQDVMLKKKIEFRPIKERHSQNSYQVLKC